MTSSWTDTAPADALLAVVARPRTQPEASLRRARYAATCSRFPQVRLSQ